eukprot:1514293-Prorocentrum_lima.AAC.1
MRSGGCPMRERRLPLLLTSWTRKSIVSLEYPKSKSDSSTSTWLRLEPEEGTRGISEPQRGVHKRIAQNSRRAGTGRNDSHTMRDIRRRKRRDADATLSTRRGTLGALRRPVTTPYVVPGEEPLWGEMIQVVHRTRRMSVRDWDE